MHSNIPIACLVIAGCSKNNVHITDMIIWRLRLPNLTGFQRSRIIQIITKINTRTIGKKSVKNALNISLDGVNNFTSVLVINQSKDKNAVEDDPIMSIDRNKLIIEVGSFKLNEYAAAINCK